VSDRRGSRGWFGFGFGFGLGFGFGRAGGADSTAAAPGSAPAASLSSPDPLAAGAQASGPLGSGSLGAGPLGVGPLGSGSLASPVTDAARAAALALALPDLIPPGAVPELTIDALGRKCPIPIIMLANQIRDVPVGSVIAVLADDPAAYSDVPAWCALKSHDCAFRVEFATGWSFGIRRGY